MKRKNILLWALTAVFFGLSIAFITEAAGVLFMVAAVLTVPIPQIQDLMAEVIAKYGKAVLIVAVIVGAVLLIPQKGASGDGGTVMTDTDVPNATVSQTTQSTQATEATQLVTEPVVTETQAPETEAPTDAPTEPTRQPTEDVTEPTQEQSVSIAFISWPEVIARGTEGSVTIKGEPNTTYSIQVYYKSGPSSAAGLEDQVSDADGYVTWTWKVSSRTGTGTFKIVVSGGGESSRVEYTIIEAE